MKSGIKRRLVFALALLLCLLPLSAGRAVTVPDTGEDLKEALGLIEDALKIGKEAAENTSGLDQLAAEETLEPNPAQTDATAAPAPAWNEDQSLTPEPIPLTDVPKRITLLIPNERTNIDLSNDAQNGVALMAALIAHACLGSDCNLEIQGTVPLDEGEQCALIQNDSGDAAALAYETVKQLKRGQGNKETTYMRQAVDTIAGDEIVDRLLILVMDGVGGDSDEKFEKMSNRDKTKTDTFQMMFVGIGQCSAKNEQQMNELSKRDTKLMDQLTQKHYGVEAYRTLDIHSIDDVFEFTNQALSARGLNTLVSFNPTDSTGSEHVRYLIRNPLYLDTETWQLVSESQDSQHIRIFSQGLAEKVVVKFSDGIPAQTAVSRSVPLSASVFCDDESTGLPVIYRLDGEILESDEISAEKLANPGTYVVTAEFSDALTGIIAESDTRSIEVIARPKYIVAEQLTVKDSLEALDKFVIFEDLNGLFESSSPEMTVTADCKDDVLKQEDSDGLILTGELDAAKQITIELHACDAFGQTTDQTVEVSLEPTTAILKALKLIIADTEPDNHTIGEKAQITITLAEDAPVPEEWSKRLKVSASINDSNPVELEPTQDGWSFEPELDRENNAVKAWLTIDGADLPGDRLQAAQSAIEIKASTPPSEPEPTPALTDAVDPSGEPEAQTIDDTAIPAQPSDEPETEISVSSEVEQKTEEEAAKNDVITASEPPTSAKLAEIAEHAEDRVFAAPDAPQNETVEQLLPVDTSDKPTPNPGMFERLWRALTLPQQVLVICGLTAILAGIIFLITGSRFTGALLIQIVSGTQEYQSRPVDMVEWGFRSVKFGTILGQSSGLPPIAELTGKEIAKKLKFKPVRNGIRIINNVSDLKGPKSTVIGSVDASYTLSDEYTIRFKYEP